MSLIGTLLTTLLLLLLLTPSLAFPLIPWYKVYRGDGSLLAGWPTQTSWLPFDAAWAAALPQIRTSCQNNGWGPDNTMEETWSVRNAILTSAAQSSIPAAFILAIVMQESRGCVRAPTTKFGGQFNPGLMQTAGRASCHPLYAKPLMPCPDTIIVDMIAEGTMGTGLGMSLKEALSAFADEEGPAKYYKAARRYNSGPGVTTPDLGVGSTNCYASDVANWLIGGMYSPEGKSGCDNANVGMHQLDARRSLDLPYREGHVVGGGHRLDSGVWDRNVTGAVENCALWYVAGSGETCSHAPSSVPTLLYLNKMLKEEDCSSLRAGYAYCIAENV
ncbi:hypothetical protein CFE70_005267 [Pyrenophora teres f. teres 0-1]